MLNRAMGVVSALSTVLIRERDLDERVATGRTQDENAERSWTYLLRDRIFFFLFISIFFFHFANAPILPTVALYVKKLGGSDKLMTATVLTAQIVMTPIALLAGRFCDSWGRKPVMAIAFWILRCASFSYTFVSSPGAVVWLQCLDGHRRRDLRGRSRSFQRRSYARQKRLQDADGPLRDGARHRRRDRASALRVLVERLGFRATFYIFTALATVGAMVFTWFVPEISREPRPAQPAPLIYGGEI